MYEVIFMKRAISLARKSEGRTSPNQPVFPNAGAARVSLVATVYYWLWL